MRKFFNRKLRVFADDRRGVAAVEFAIGVPVLLFMLIIMTDVGLAVNERMNLDQSVRAGADFVMKDVSDLDDIKKLMTAAATGTYADDPGEVELAARPDYSESVTWCECPDNPGAVVACNAYLCSNEKPPSRYYLLVAKKDYEGILLPKFTLNTEINVQVR